MYTDPNAATASASGTVVVTLPPTAVSYTATETDNVYQCTTWIVTDANGDSDTLYLDDTSGDFLTDPSAAHCIDGGPAGYICLIYGPTTPDRRRDRAARG